MKLVFPGGEHPQVLLGPGVNRVGSDPQSNIVLDRRACCRSTASCMSALPA